MAHRSLSSGDRLLRQRILTSPPGRSRPLFNSPHQCSAYICGTVYTPAMSRIAIKICGLSTRETVDAAIYAGASHVGSEGHTSDLQSLIDIPYASFCCKKKKN